MDIDLTGRYIKCINDFAITHYPCNEGDYLLFREKNKEGVQYWGLAENVMKGIENTNVPNYFGFDIHLNSSFQLMPIGFIPPAEDKFLGALIANVGSGRRYIITEVLEDKYITVAKNGSTKQEIHRPLKDTQWEVLSIKSNSVERLKDYQDNAITKPMEQKEDYTGRYVKALVDNPYSIMSNKGDVMFINKLKSIRYKVTFKDKDEYVINYPLNTSLFELLPKDYNPNTPITFKVGDKVKIINRKPGNTTGVEGKSIDTIGYVESLTNNLDKTNSYMVTNKDMLLKVGTYKYYGVFNVDDLELLPSDTNTEPSLLDQVIADKESDAKLAFHGEIGKPLRMLANICPVDETKALEYAWSLMGRKEQQEIETIESVKVQLTRKNNKRKF